MKATEATITINAKLTVDEHTANACLKMVELYVNGTGRNVIVEKQNNGELQFRFDDEINKGEA